MRGYISKEAALNVLRALEEPAPTAQHVSAIFDCEDAISRMPDAEVRSALRTLWAPIGGDEWCCPACGHVVNTEGSWEHPLKVGKKFCENCGADMRGDKNE